MPKISFLKLKNWLNDKRNENNIEIPYFLYGSEKYLVKRYEEFLLNFFLKKYNEECDIQKMSGDEKFDIEKFKDSVLTPSFMHDKKIILLRNLDITKLSASELKKFEATLSNLPNSVLLIISQKLLEINLKKSAKWKKFIDSHSSDWVVTEFEVPDKIFIERQLLQWAKNSGKKMDAKTAKLMVSRCGNDLNNLKNEMTKVILFENLKNNDKITEESVISQTIELPDSNVFDMFRAIMLKDKKKVFKIFEILISNRTEPIAICAALTSNYINIFRAKVIENLHKNIYDLIEIFGYKGRQFLITSAARYAKNMSMDEVDRCIERLVDTEILLKTTSFNSKIVLTELLFKLCQE